MMRSIVVYGRKEVTEVAAKKKSWTSEPRGNSRMNGDGGHTPV
jgi:hypothetical protein